jgi:hypothetical protein
VHTTGWNVFDTVVVSISILGISLESMPGLSVLRLLRAFRVLRLFGRLGAHRRLLYALTASLLPVVNAMVVVALVISVYGILGVDFFGDKHPRFATFAEATFTMFQVFML